MVTANAVIVGAFFDRLSVSANERTSLDKYGTINDVESPGQCAVVCAAKRSEERVCQAYHFRPADETCEFYSITVPGMVPAPPSLGIEMFQIKLADVFHRVLLDGQYSFIYASSDTVKYADARTNCVKLGGYLLHFDSVAKYEAITQIITGHPSTSNYFFVGANDLRAEGQWVAEKDNEPLDQSTWLWAGSQPNDVNGNEDCAIFRRGFDKLFDNDCDRLSSYLCERDALDSTQGALY